MSDPSQLAEQLFGRGVCEAELRRSAWPGLRGTPPSGITPVQWRWLRRWHQLREQWALESACATPCLRDGPEVLNYLNARLADCRSEHFVMLLLDAQLSLLGTETLSLGSINEARVYPREVLTRVIDYQAVGVIFAHNHPSGCAHASAQDQALTRRLEQLLATIEVTVHDHFVVTHTGAYSVVHDQFFPKRLS